MTAAFVAVCLCWVALACMHWRAVQRIESMRAERERDERAMVGIRREFARAIGVASEATCKLATRPKCVRCQVRELRVRKRDAKQRARLRQLAAMHAEVGP